MDSPRKANDDIELDARDAAQRRRLGWVLAINLAQAVGIGIAGFVAQSTGLMGAALDNLADSMVYALNIHAVGRSLKAKVRAARFSGYFLIILALGLLVEVMRRMMSGAEPVGTVMIIAAIVNASSNAVCLKLLRAHRSDGVNLKASWIFTTNDMYANAGIAVSGIAVMWLNTPTPDLIMGLIIAGIAFAGGREILNQARSTLAGETTE